MVGCRIFSISPWLDGCMLDFLNLLNLPLNLPHGDLGTMLCYVGEDRSMMVKGKAHQCLPRLRNIAINLMTSLTVS